MADERTDLIKRLAPLVLEDRSRAAADKRSTDIPWYFININHPAMRPLLQQLVAIARALVSTRRH